MIKTLVTIIIPVYKVEKYLVKCVDSVLNQTYKNIEVILVDDGSPDECPKLCDMISKKDGRVRVIHKANGGLGNARNSGMDMAKGQFVTFIDSDDWIELNRIEKMVSVMSERSLDAVISGYTLCSDTGNVLHKVPLSKTGIYFGDQIKKEVLLPLICANIDNPNDDTLPVGAVFKLYKMDIIRNNNLRFISEKKCLAEDIFFNTEYFSFCSTVKIIEDYGYMYRMNPKSISNTYTTERADRGFIYYENLMELIKKKGLLDEGKHIVERSYIGKCRVALKLIYNSSRSLKWKHNEVMKILNHSYTIETLRFYPINKYNFGLKITAYLMKNKSFLGLHICFMIRRILGKAN